MRVPTLLALVAGTTLALAAFSPVSHAQPAPRAAAGSAPAGGAAPVAQAADLPIRRITLYRSGVASFERRGLVQDDVLIQLRFKTDQINDILKSMVVLDLSRGKGRVDGISYASREPLDRRLASFGVDLSDNPTLPAMLTRLRGSGVTLALPEGNLSGTIIGTEMRAQAMGNAQQPISVPFLNVLTPTGIRSVSLYDIRGAKLDDAALADELAKALAALAEHRADRTKTVDIHLSGEDAREIVVAYVQESPVWKTSYRLVLPDAPQTGPGDSASPADRFTLQGWAIVENTTDEDWTNVGLSLVSGRPVSFRMDLYEPLYLDRPELAVPTEAGALARAYDGGEEAAAELAEVDAAPGRSLQSRGRRDEAFSMGAPVAPAPAAGRAAEMLDKRLSSGEMADYAGAGVGRGVETGEVFQFEISHPVTVERQRSAMLLITNTGIDGRRVSIYNAADNPAHPMRGVRVTNSTGAPLMPGPIAVYDAGTYAGDAVVSHVPAGDDRLLAYAVDLDVRAETTSRPTQELQKFRIAGGLLESSTLVTSRTIYAMSNKDTQRPRTILIEHPKMDGWELVGPAKPAETTADTLRFSLDVPAGKAASLDLAFRRVERQTFAIVSFDLTRLAAYARQGKVSDAVVAAVRDAAKRQSDINALTQRLSALETERREIGEDQSRVRQNIGSIDRTNELYSRYMKKLNDQETRLEAIENDLAQTRAAQEKAQRDLATFIASLNVE
ncbi:MAG: hypothetical protein SFY69_10920 [Planctomycetota bacterium]|nr:hypothetical protein [Planctomycetota bacterium]